MRIAKARKAISVAILAMAWLALWGIFFAMMLAMCGCSTPVDANLNATAGVSVPVASPSDNRLGDIHAPKDDHSSKSTATSQPANQAANANQSAGRDNRPIGIDVNASGSGWSTVVVSVAMAGVFLLMWMHSNGQLRKANANAAAVGQCVQDIGPSSTRDNLLTLLQTTLPHRELWERQVRKNKVKRRVDPG